MPPSAAAVFFLAFEALLILDPVATLALDAEALPCFFPAIFYLGMLDKFKTLYRLHINSNFKL